MPRHTLSPVPRRVAILLHTLLDGSSHVDLLVAPDDRERGDEDRDVAAWRCGERPDRAPSGTTLALEPIEPHRALYLRLDAPRRLDRGRGEVQPLRRGAADERDGAMEIRWDDGGRSSFAFVARETGPALIVR